MHSPDPVPEELYNPLGIKPPDWFFGFFSGLNPSVKSDLNNPVLSYL